MNKHHLFLHFIAKVYGAKLVIKRPKKDRRIRGEYDVESRTIIVYDFDNLHVSICALFHELGHDYCVKNNKWVDYHTRPIMPLNGFRTAWQAENWVDKWAESEYYRVFRGGFRGQGYEQLYRSDCSKQYIKELYQRVA